MIASLFSGPDDGKEVEVDDATGLFVYTAQPIDLGICALPDDPCPAPSFRVAVHQRVGINDQGLPVFKFVGYEGCQ